MATNNKNDKKKKYNKSSSNKNNSNNKNYSKKKAVNKKTNNTKKPVNKNNKSNNKKNVKKNNNLKKYNNKKPVKKVTNNKKKYVKPKKVPSTASNVEILDKILEESKTKKLNKKQRIVDKNQVSNKVVIDILKNEQEDKTKTPENLIITREIDISELKEYIEKESQIIESNIDKKLEKEPEEEVVITETKNVVKPKKKRKRKKKKKQQAPPFEPPVIIPKKTESWTIILLIVLVGLLLIVLGVGLTTFNDLTKGTPGVQKIFVDKEALAKEEEEREKRKLERMYNFCLTELRNDSDTSEEIVNYVNDLNSYFSSKYKTSIRYVDLEHGFEYEYNPEKVYYAASTIKALDAIYVYSKAAAGEINLDDTMTYTSKYNFASSYYMTKHKYGEKITIRDLVKYAVTRSDNRAHQMLVDYIGFSKLKEYGNSLGATKTLIGGDNFGSITVDDAISYWQEINRFINTNEELGPELKNYFLEADQNYLNFPDQNIEAIHKYGEYENYYHDIGIVYAKNPYMVAILTSEGRNGFEKVIRDINSKINELNNLYMANREAVCKEKVYK